MAVIEQLVAGPSVVALLIRARRALHLTQRQLGVTLGWSERTGERWEQNGTAVSPTSLRKLASLVHPIDAALAAEIAATTGDTLESLGILGPPPPAAAPGPAPAPAVAKDRPLPLSALVDLVVFSAADAIDASPGEVRPAFSLRFAARASSIWT